MGQGELEGCARAAVGSPVFPNLRCSDDVPTVDPDRADAGRWYTSKPCFPAIKSHISHLVGDSAWEGHAANVFEGRDEVIAYAKNDHLGFQIQYMWAGSRRRYVPDFLVRLSSGKMLALEIKGTDSPQNKAKRDALSEWVKAINGTGGFGQWAWDVAFKPSDVQDIVTKHAKAAVPEPVGQ